MIISFKLYKRLQRVAELEADLVSESIKMLKLMDECEMCISRAGPDIEFKGNCGSHTSRRGQWMILVNKYGRYNYHFNGRGWVFGYSSNRKFIPNKLPQDLLNAMKE